MDREFSVWNAAKGEYDSYIIPDPTRLSWLSRVIYAVADGLVRFVDWWIDHSPAGAAMNGECDRIKREIAEHSRELREKYPEDYERAKMQVEMRYGITLD